MAEIQLYTDGACSGNPGPGGYGLILISGEHRREISAGFLHTTNNRMELMAVIVGLESLKGAGHSVQVFSDSKYVVDAFLKNWISGWRMRRLDKVKNPDLWMRLLRAMEGHRVTYHWVKGHADNPFNNRCDELAVAASKSNSLQKDL